MADFINLYEALELASPDVPAAQVEQALLKLNSKINARRGKAMNDADLMRELSGLLDIQKMADAELRDPARREQYNKRLIEWLHSGGGGGGSQKRDFVFTPEEEAALAQARFYVEYNEHEKAFAEVRNVARRFPNSPTIWWYFGELAMANYQLEEATDAFYKALFMVPDSWEISASLANCYRMLGRSGDARRQLEKTVQLADAAGASSDDIREQLRKLAADVQHDERTGAFQREFESCLPIDSKQKFESAKQVLAKWRTDRAVDPDTIAEAQSLVQEAGAVKFDPGPYGKLKMTGVWYIVGLPGVACLMVGIYGIGGALTGDEKYSKMDAIGVSGFMTLLGLFLLIVAITYTKRKWKPGWKRAVEAARPY